MKKLWYWNIKQVRIYLFKKIFETSNNELFITSYIGTFSSKSTNCNYKLYVAVLIK